MFHHEAHTVSSISMDTVRALFGTNPDAYSSLSLRFPEVTKATEQDS